MIRAFAIMLALVAAPLSAAQVPPVPAAAAPIDPARLAIATRISRQTLPAGSYAKIFGGMGDQISAMVSDQTMNLSLRDLAAAMNLDAQQTATLGPGTVGEIIAIIDPAFAERQRLTTKAIFDGMASVMAQFEPEMREGMAEAYASRFTAVELTEIERFFATPTGARFAAEAILIANDPAVAKRTQAMTPVMLKEMPALIARATAATAGLPKPRKAEDMTPDQCREIARLIGLDGAERCDRTRPNPKT